MKQNIRVKRSYNYNGKCMITQDLCWKGGNFCEQCETVLNYKPISQKQNEQKRFVKNCDPCFMMNELGFKSCEMCKGSKEETLKAIDEAQKREEKLLFGNKPISKKENNLKIIEKPKKQENLVVKKENFIIKLLKKIFGG